MSSHRRAPGVPDVPPFRGVGPLQARGVPNQTVNSTEPRFIASKAAPAPPSKAMPPPKITSDHPSSHQKRSQPSTTSSREGKTSSSSQQNKTQSSTTEPRPSSRLANEKKKDYKDPAFIGPWKLGKLIGQGASGRVRHAVNTSTGLQAAIKIVPKQILASSRMSIRDVSAKQDKMTLGIEREIVIMKLIEHPNVLGLMDVYETSKELYLILEYVAGGELFDYLVSKGRLRPTEARAYFRQIIFGLHYCHSFNICHRDLKPENLLLDGSKRTVKVADFGMAALQPNEKMLETSCGSPHYASPEIVSGKSYKGTASDIWSCGIILFALLCGRLPFDDPNIQTLLGKVRLGKFDMPDYLESHAKDLIWKMLTVDPEKRYKMRDIMRHPWFTDNGQLSSTNPVSTDLDKLAEEELDMNNLDLDILSNLKTLWPEFSQQDIIEQLMSKGPNWKKTFYSLLVQHRENYSGDDDEDDDDDVDLVEASSSPAKGNSLGLSLGINPMANQKSSEQQRTASPTAPASIAAVPTQNIRANANSSQRPVSMVQTSHIAPHIQSPVISSVATGSPRIQVTNIDESRRPVSMLASPPSSPRRPLPSPTMQSPTHSPVKSMQSPASGFGSAKHAQQALQQQQVQQDQSSSPVRPVHDRARSDNVIPGRTASPTTPNRTRLRSSSVADDSTPKQIAPPRPNSRASTMRPQSAQGQRGDDGRSPMVQLPGQSIGNASMQQFFREIADELASIRVNGERPISLQRKLEQLERMAADVRSEARRSQSPNGRTRSPRRDDDPMAQFDDAEDDVEDAYSFRSGTASEASSNPYSPTTPMTEPYSPALRTKPLAVADKDLYNGGRMPASVAMSAASGSNAGTRTTSVQSSATTQSNCSTGSGGSLGRRRSLLLRMKSQKSKNQAAQVTQENANSTLAYERLQEAGAMAQKAQQGSRVQSRNPGLGLDIGSPALGNAGIKSPTLSVYSAASSAPPTPSTPNSAMTTPGSRSSSGASPKQSWFAGLFNWKPATCTLMSVENFSTTHAEAKRLLQSCGARVFVEDSENTGTLKCSLAEVRTGGAQSVHSTESHHSAKPLRFRVEFQILPMSSSASPALGSSTPRSIGSAASPNLSANGVAYATSVTLVQEKGSLSTFKQIYHAMRDLWVLDVPNSSPALNKANSPIASPGIAQVGLGVSMRGASADHGGNSTGGMLSPRFR